ncbi:MAG: lipopolysaccharide biosynthesis protein [Oscillospiraceae bacterium]
MKHKNQLQAGSLLTYVQMTLNIIVSLAYTPVMLRILGQSEYGLYSTIASTISMLSILSLGFGGSYVRYYVAYRKEQAQDRIARLNGLFFVVFSVIGVIALICGLYLSFHLDLIFKDGLTADQYPTAQTLMIFLTVNLALSFPMSVFSNIISAQEQFIFLKATEILRTVVSPLLTLPILLMGYGSIGMVVVTVAVSLIVYLLHLFYCLFRLHVRFSFRNFEKKVLKDIAVFSGFIAINMIVDQVNNNLDKLILTRFCGTTATAVYAVGQQLHTYFISFSTAVSSVFTPRIHQLVQDNKANLTKLREVLTELFVRVGRIQFLILALICTGIIFFGKPFIYFWAGDGYEQAYYIVLLLIIPGMVPLCQNLGIEMQRAQNMHQYRSVIYGVMAIGNLVVSIYLCQIWGAIGCAVGTAIAVTLANGLAMNIFYQKRLNIDVVEFWKNILHMLSGLIPPALCGIVLVRFVNLYRIPTLLLCILVYAAVYCVSVWLLSMNEYEKQLVSGIVRKVWKR